MDDGWEGGREEGKGVGRQAKEFRGKETKKKKSVVNIWMACFIFIYTYIPIFHH
jgi:hypothetical protein